MSDEQLDKLIDRGSWAALALAIGAILIGVWL